MANRPIRLVAPSEPQETSNTSLQPAGPEQDRKAPPRVRKPLARNDQCFAPRSDLAGHRKRLREAFGDTMSDEFVDVILGKAMRQVASDELGIRLEDHP